MSPPRLPFRHPGRWWSDSSGGARSNLHDMADATTTDESSHVLRWLFLIAVAVGAVIAGRQWALSKADAEFEARLLAADEQRG